PKKEPVAASPPEEPAPAAILPPLPFEWPQLAGTPTHDTRSAFRERIDLIQRPCVLWRQPGLGGQPTISGTDLYSGGRGLWHVDLVSSRVSAGDRDVDARVRTSSISLRHLLSDSVDRKEWLLRLAFNGLDEVAC